MKKWLTLDIRNNFFITTFKQLTQVYKYSNNRSQMSWISKCRVHFPLVSMIQSFIVFPMTSLFFSFTQKLYITSKNVFLKKKLGLQVRNIYTSFSTFFVQKGVGGYSPQVPPLLQVMYYFNIHYFLPTWM